MGLIKIFPTTKNYALYADKELAIKSDFVPRVGEVITADFGLDTDQLFVFKIEYEIDATHGLIPNLYCREWYEGDRKVELLDQGWL